MGGALEKPARLLFLVTEDDFQKISQIKSAITEHAWLLVNLLLLTLPSLAGTVSIKDGVMAQWAVCTTQHEEGHSWLDETRQTQENNIAAFPMNSFRSSDCSTVGRYDILNNSKVDSHSKYSSHLQPPYIQIGPGDSACF